MQSKPESGARLPLRVLACLAVLPFAAEAARGPVNSQAVEEVRQGRRTEARASWWGYDAEDATAALQGAINSGARKVIVENLGTPWIVNKIQLAGNQELFFEKGVVVLAKRGAFKGSADALFTASLKTNVTLNGYGATFRMWRQDYAGTNYSKAEWRHTLSLLSSSQIKVLGLTLAESGGDGIYLGVSRQGVANTDVLIKDVVCTDNHRQGISVISAENLLIENCVLKGTAGTAPMAGIDFEPNHPSEKLVNCVMRNCVSENNQGDAYEFYIKPLTDQSAPVSIRLENCRSIGCRDAVSLATGNGDARPAVKGRIEFIDCHFEGSQQAGLSLREKPASGARVRFVRCEFANTAVKQPESAPLRLASGVGNTEAVGGVEFVDCVVRDPVQRLPMSYQDLAGGLKLKGVSGTLIVEHDGRRVTHALDQKLIDTWMPHQAFKEIPPFLTAGVTYRPALPNASLPGKSTSFARLREHAEYLLWARAGDEVSFTVSIQPVGRPTAIEAPVRIRSPLGKETVLKRAKGGEMTAYTFAAKETGAHEIVCEPKNWTADVRSTTHRVCLYAPRGSFHLLATRGTFYFWVPKRTAEFAVRISGGGGTERVKATIRDASGRTVQEKDNIDQAQQFVLERAPSADGEIWSLALDRPAAGVLEDFYAQLQGVPPVLAGSREALLQPAE